MPTILEFAHMSSGAYDDQPSVAGWIAAPPIYDRNSGLRTVVFTNRSIAVVAFRGTDAVSDLVEDAELSLGMNTAMYPVAQQIVAQVGANAPVLVTGHSLGGAVAQTVGKRMEVPFVTFNAPGVALLASQNIVTANPHMVALRLAGALHGAQSRPMQALQDMRSAFNTVNGVNYRLSIDIVSSTGVHYGDVVTLPAGTADPYQAHRIVTMIGVLSGVSAGRLNFPS